MKNSTEDVLRIYKDLKTQNNGLPLKYREFLSASGINKRFLVQVFGSNAYTKLQELAGDIPNKLNLEKTPLEKIMRDYGDLASEVINEEDRLPTSSHWLGKNLRPTESGLNRVHHIKWSEFSQKFYMYCSNNIGLRDQYKHVLKFIETSGSVVPIRKNITAQDKLFNIVYHEVIKWSPALRRNSEEAYKSELSLHLKQIHSIQKYNFDIREERGDSRCDIGISSQVGIEIKKSPSLCEYDRCFGQTARHLENYKFVLIVIFDVLKQEQYDYFCQLVDKYYSKRVRVLKNG